MRIVQVQLSCECWVTVPLKAARLLSQRVCNTHHRVATIAHVNAEEWHAYCQSCSWERWTGQSQSAAHRAVRLHHGGGRYDHCTRTEYGVIPGLGVDSIPTAHPETAIPSQEIDHD